MPMQSRTQSIVIGRIFISFHANYQALRRKKAKKLALMGISISHRNQATSTLLTRQLKIGKRRLHCDPGSKARIDQPQQVAKSYGISQKGIYTSLLGVEAVRCYGKVRTCFLLLARLSHAASCRIIQRAIASSPSVLQESSP
jgi:hypothetical protein